MNSDLTVSVVVPVYNVEKYVEKCLMSLESQSYKQIEIIVVDDGSTDKSGEICEKIAARDERVRVFRKQNGGLSSARNYGIKKARGEYICLVDSDDFVKEDFVAKMVGALDDAVDVVICGYNKEVPRAEVLTGEEVATRLLIGQNNIEVVAWNKMYRREMFDEIRYPEGRNYEDTLTTYKLLVKAKKVAYVAEALYEYVERKKSITKNDDKEKRLLVREEAALEAVQYFATRKKLREAAEIAVLTAKLALVDFAICGEVDKKYIDEGTMWVKKNKEKLLKNKFLNKKLKLYVILITNAGGKMYKLFRKVWHE